MRQSYVSRPARKGRGSCAFVQWGPAQKCLLETLAFSFGQAYEPFCRTLRPV